MEMNERLNQLLADAGYDNVKEFAKAVRNETLLEVADELKRFEFAFGQDTVDSFAAFVRSMKK
jgi:hypothetical protein